MGKNLSFVLNNLEDLVAAFFISITTILVVINIVLRYVFNSGLVWSEEVATGCFVWSVFIGAVAVFKHRGHVGVDIIVKRIPQGMQKAIGLITDVILVALNGYMSYLSIIYISGTGNILPDKFNRIHGHEYKRNQYGRTDINGRNTQYRGHFRIGFGNIDNRKIRHVAIERDKNNVGIYRSCCRIQASRSRWR